MGNSRYIYLLNLEQIWFAKGYKTKDKLGFHLIEHCPWSKPTNPGWRRAEKANWWSCWLFRKHAWKGWLASKVLDLYVLCDRLSCIGQCGIAVLLDWLHAWIWVFDVWYSGIQWPYLTQIQLIASMQSFFLDFEIWMGLLQCQCYGEIVSMGSVMFSSKVWKDWN